MREGAGFKEWRMKMRASKKEEIEAGKYYGYPECCVRYFANTEDIKGINLERAEEIGPMYHAYVTMFCVPCPKCYAVLLRNKKQFDNAFSIEDKYAKIRVKKRR